MAELFDLQPPEREALGRALEHSLAERITEGRAELDRIGTEVLNALYTAGLRLGIEAHALAARRQALPASPPTPGSTTHDPR